MKKTIAKQVIKGVVAIIIAVVSYLGGQQSERAKINTESIEQVKKSNDSNNNVTTNVNVDSADSVDEVIKTLLTENKDLQGEIDELKQSASSAEVTNSSEDSTSDSASGTTTNTDEGFVDLVYDGDNYEVYTLDNDNGSFKIAGQEYHSGITIGSGKGFILTNLGKKYTHVSLEIGRVDESSIQNGTMLVIRDGKETNSYSLDAEKTLEQIDFDVTGTNNLKIQVDTDWSNYGIVNIKLK